MKLSHFALTCAGLLALLAAAPAQMQAQESECEGCNNLTDKCGPNEPNIQQFCYEDEDPEGQPYCHAYGGMGDCPPSFAMGADGLPALDPTAELGSLTLVVVDGVTAAVDCRGRLRRVMLSAVEGEELRRRTTRIVL